MTAITAALYKLGILGTTKNTRAVNVIGHSHMGLNRDVISETAQECDVKHLGDETIRSIVSITVNTENIAAVAASTICAILLK
ncbi:hypothetical protein TU77_18720 [Pseudomonas synxantha]|nr:hypothetical protein TU77_18720 [Pseudomonas synxantha]